MLEFLSAGIVSGLAALHSTRRRHPFSILPEGPQDTRPPMQDGQRPAGGAFSARGIDSLTRNRLDSTQVR